MITQKLMDKLKTKLLVKNGCWVWLGSIGIKNGYGRNWVPEQKRVRYTHHIFYEFYKSPIPNGLEVDHKCRNRACCNPDHLEAVTHAENMKRSWQANKTHCRNGHALSGDNLYIEARGRGCKTCRSRQTKAFFKKNPEYGRDWKRAHAG